MGTTLDHGIYLPDEGERNCYDGLAGNWVALDNHLGSTDIHVTINDKQAWNGHVADTTIHVTSADKQAWNGHVADTTIHVTAEDKQTWNGKADASALTAHTGNTTIHVTAEDKQAWNGKADASALTAHTGDTTIHVTAEDKAKWDAVTSKADDSAVVHNTGNETVTGIKSFSDDTFVKSLNFTNEVASPSSSSSAIMPIITTVTYTDQSTPQSATVNLRISADGSKSFYPNENGLYSLGLVSRNWDNVFSYMFESFGKNLGNEFSNNARTNLYLKANKDTSGQSGVYISKFRQNRAQGGMRDSDVVQVTFDVLENSVRTNRLWYLNWVNWENDVPKTVEVRSLCAKVDYKLTHINDTEPSALGMPDLSNGIDISSYLTNAGTVTPSEYTPSVNGYICIQISAGSPPFIRMYNDYGFDNSVYTERNEVGSTSGGTYTRFASLIFPANKDVKVYIIVMPSTFEIISAKFYPCYGNV